MVDILLNLGLCLFMIGFITIITGRKNIINIFCGFELIFLAAILNFINFAHFQKTFSGYSMALFLLVIIAIHAVAILSVAMVYFRKHDTTKIKEINTMRG